jgi:hypothetical protein
MTLRQLFASAQTRDVHRRDYLGSGRRREQEAEHSRALHTAV